MTKENWAPLDKDVAPLREGGATITVWTLDDKPDIQINIALERQDLFWYPNSFPEIQELQRALSSAPKEIKQQHRYTTFWDGPSYQVSVSHHTSDETRQIVFKIRKANLNVYFKELEWESLHKILNLSVTQSDIPFRVDALKLRYGSSF